MTKKNFKRIVSLFLLAIMLVTNGASVFAQVSDDDLNKVIKDTYDYMYKTVKNPIVGSVGGEWAVIGLARSGYPVTSDYLANYYRNVEDYVKSRSGVLDDVKHTEYSRVIVALSSIGKDAKDVAGYDLTLALGDFDKTVYQGLNGSIWALIALDSMNYPMPVNKSAKTQATRDMYIQEILDRQLNDGGWSLFGEKTQESKRGASDPDITGMALQALAKYQDRTDVKIAVEKALTCMSKMQNGNGGYSSWGSENLESCVQMLVALTELGVSLDDPRFIKDGKGLLDNLLTYHKPGQGFVHVYEGGRSSQMASEQGLYGIVAAKRARDGKNSLYRMDDALTIKLEKNSDDRLRLVGKEKNKTIKKEIRFVDVSKINHEKKSAIEALSTRGIIMGKTKDLFEPNSDMTRAEFASIIVKALDLDLVQDNSFKDIKESNWYYKAVSTANKHGIVKGKSKDLFEPNGKISKEEAATMLMRAGKIAGLELDLNTGSIRDILAGFEDYVKVSDWAREGLAFTYNQAILDDKEMKINPKKHITRGEISQMVFNMLKKSNLL